MLAIMAGEPKTSDLVIRIVAQCELELSKREGKQTSIFAQHAPLGVPAALLPAGTHGSIEISKQGGIGALSEASAESGEGVGHGCRSMGWPQVGIKERESKTLASRRE